MSDCDDQLSNNKDEKDTKEQIIHEEENSDQSVKDMEERNKTESEEEQKEKKDERGEEKSNEDANADDVERKENECKEKQGSNIEKQHDWQAVWDATRQAWYFWNQVTQETTWENPLAKDTKNEEVIENMEREPENENENNADFMHSMTDEEVAQSVGIDPDLAYLDPVMYANEIHQARMGSTHTSSTSYHAQGAFDSRTGKFISQSNLKRGAIHDPSRLSHANQADRQMDVFFDVQQYEDQRKREHERIQNETDEQGRIKKQKPSKKELKFFKERAKEKKASKQAWLRN